MTQWRGSNPQTPHAQGFTASFARSGFEPEALRPVPGRETGKLKTAPDVVRGGSASVGVE